MPYGPRQQQKGKELTDPEREQKVRELQAEQEDRLRRAIGDEFFEFLAEYDEGLNEWLRRLRQDVDVLTQD